MSRSPAAAAGELLASAEAARWRGADPYDGLWWDGWPRAVVGRKRGRQLVIQAHARAPVDVRRLYRVGDPVNPKALALLGVAGLRLARATRDPLPAEYGREALDLLVDDVAAGPVAWGYPFPVQTRWSFYAANTPNIIVTSFASMALAEAGRESDGAARLARGQAGARWILETLFAEPEGWFVYHPESRALIHNANVLGARVVHTVLGADGGAGDAVRRALEPTLAAQRPDGGFPYGDAPGLEWIDSFHTGYVLDALLDLRGVDPRVDDALRRGTEQWSQGFFGPRGEARLWADRPWPQDGHSAGTASGVLSRLADAGYADPELVGRIAAWTAAEVVRGGHAVHRRWRWGHSRVAYIRWCDAHVAHGLATYALLQSAPRSV